MVNVTECREDKKIFSFSEQRTTSYEEVIEKRQKKNHKISTNQVFPHHKTCFVGQQTRSLDSVIKKWIIGNTKVSHYI